MTKPPAEKLLIGWREWISLPDLGVAAIKSKVDTGARSSTLHAFDLTHERVSTDATVIRFFIHPFQDDDANVVEASAPLVEYREVRSSNGDREVRPVIASRIRLFGRSRRVELTLTNRDEMGFRILLGRSAVRRRFIVDPSRSFIGGGDSVAPPRPD
ncbi:MAG: ATP-dependent zinc protease family protein [Acidimicrobiales bacterium]